MTNIDLANKIFFFSLLIALLSSFYILLETIIMQNKSNKYLFNTWQFPMLLALFFDAVFLSK